MQLSSRQKDIFDLLQSKERVSVKELSGMLYVSEMTIRRDLKEMEEGGYVKRFRGGALYNMGRENQPIANRLCMNEKEKKRLAIKASRFLRDDINVFIDSSATCSYILGHIKKYHNISVYTNSVNSLQIASKFHIPCILLGGEYNESDMCLVGPIAEMQAERINVDIAFFTTLGFSDDGVASDTDLRQTAVRRKIMENSKQNIFLFEKSKLHKKFIYTLCTQADNMICILND